MSKEIKEKIKKIKEEAERKSEKVEDLNEEELQMLNEIVMLGHELEAIEYNKKFIGYDGFTTKGLQKERNNIRWKIHSRIDKLSEIGFNVLWETDYVYTDENGVDWELEYALQFY